MNAQSFRPSTIEALKSLWVALPVRASNDGADGDPRERQMAILQLYCDVLSECSETAIWNTVNNLRAGKIEDASKSFCPKAPELAVMVRSEQARLDAINRPKAIPYQPKPRDYLVHAVMQRKVTGELAKQGYRCIAKDVDHIMSINMWKKKERSVGSRWFASLQEVWEPPHV
ncbi:MULTISPECIES: hypothetical protein [unclassified Rhizobium]|uniref:hypothetical protein n=1 Tax=unclassified Rhizobium TaxID=2613769 RepID=UPI002478E568|nr:MULTISPECIES: hypothetical protein [unclassified Rhizobium]MDH7801301.1 hypothetical protein [Rhizobium sp. AN70]